MSYKILVVDDDKDIRTSLTVKLTHEGYDVECAHDGVSATSAAVNGEPDLVLLDVSMPAGDGLMVLERLQENPKTSAIPVIIVTASKKPDLQQQALRGGARAFVEKPFKVERLLMTIENILSLNDSYEV